MLFYIKKWMQDIVRYPKMTITPSPLSYDHYWDERNRGSVVSVSDWQKDRANILLRYLNKNKELNPVIADIGCGDGAILSYVKRQLPGMRGIGIDISDRILEPVAAAGFETRRMDFSDSNQRTFPQSDYALLFEVIEHVVDSEALVFSALHSARKGVWISIPNTGFFTYRLRLLFGKFPAQWAYAPHEHVRYWTYRDLKWWLSALTIKGTIIPYRGVPLLRDIFPGFFAEGLVVFIPSEGAQ